MEMINEAKADLNVRRENDRKTPLLVACQMKDERLVEALLENGADKDVKDIDGI